MNNHQTIADLEPLLIHLQKAAASSTRAVGQAQEVNQALRTEQHQHLLLTLEFGRLENLANAEAYPEHRNYYIAKAERCAGAYAVLSAPEGTLGATP